MGLRIRRDLAADMTAAERTIVMGHYAQDLWLGAMTATLSDGGGQRADAVLGTTIDEPTLDRPASAPRATCASGCKCKRAFPNR